MKDLNYEYIVGIMNKLHENELYELESWVSLGLDTGFRSEDFEKLTREDIVNGKVLGFYCIKSDGLYPEAELSFRSLSLLEYLPKTGVLFPKKQHIYLRQVCKYVDEKITWLNLREINIKRKFV